MKDSHSSYRFSVTSELLLMRFVVLWAKYFMCRAGGSWRQHFSFRSTVLVKWSMNMCQSWSAHLWQCGPSERRLPWGLWAEGDPVGTCADHHTGRGAQTAPSLLRKDLEKHWDFNAHTSNTGCRNFHMHEMKKCFCSNLFSALSHIHAARLHDWRKLFFYTSFVLYLSHALFVETVSLKGRWGGDESSLPQSKYCLTSSPPPAVKVRYKVGLSRPVNDKKLNWLNSNCYVHVSLSNRWKFSPFFSTASNSLASRGGAVSGRENCSVRSSRQEPGGESDRLLTTVKNMSPARSVTVDWNVISHKC